MKSIDLVGEREGAHAQRVEMRCPARSERRQRLVHRGRGRAEIDHAEAASAAPRRARTGAGHERLGGLELAQQPLHVVDVGRALLGVAGVAVARRAAGEVGAAWSGACRDRCGRGCRRRRRRGSGRSRVPASSSSAVITLPRSSWRASSQASGSAQPLVHADVEVEHDEDRRLQPVGEVEGRARRTRSTRAGPRGSSSTCLVSPCEA